MKIFILIFFSMSLQAETFKIAGDLSRFNESEGLLLKGCEKNCEALKVIKKHGKIDLKSARAGMKTTNSVGSDVCLKIYKADSILGTAQNKDMRAFCMFKDHSMVEMNSLTEYLLKKKIVKE